MVTTTRLLFLGQVFFVSFGWLYFWCFPLSLLLRERLTEGETFEWWRSRSASDDVGGCSNRGRPRPPPNFLEVDGSFHETLLLLRLVVRFLFTDFPRLILGEGLAERWRLVSLLLSVRPPPVGVSLVCLPVWLSTLALLLVLLERSETGLPDPLPEGVHLCEWLVDGDALARDL